jgi:sn-glycerol 3-phosphate transport system ATP-binding protein
VFQNYALFPHLTVADNILFGLQVRKAPRAVQQERLHNVLSLVGLDQLAARKPSQLSGGQQQRVALARAIVAQKTVCLMDEPLSNLDAKLRQEMRAELRDLQQKLKLTVVYVTHDQTEAMSMADQVILMNQGRIEQAATPRDMYAEPQTTFAAKFIGTPSMSLLDLNNPAIAACPAFASRPATAVTLGVRPEDVSISREPSPGTSAVTATVASVEYLGADSILRCNVGDALLHARVLGQARWDANTPVYIDWPASANHWFDADGRRVVV